MNFFNLDNELEDSNEKNLPENRVTVVLPNGTRYENLIEVEQDSYAGRLDVDASPKANALYSSGFASCFALIFKSQDRRRFSLSHVSSLNKEDKDANFLTAEAEFISKGNQDDYSVEFAICRAGYQIAKAPDDPEVNEYFTQSIKEYSDAFAHILNKKPTVIHELSSACMLILDSKGEINKFDGLYEDEIQVVEYLDGAKSTQLLPKIPEVSLSTPLSSEIKESSLVNLYNFLPPPPLSQTVEDTNSKKRKFEKTLDNPLATQSFVS